MKRAIAFCSIAVVLFAGLASSADKPDDPAERERQLETELRAHLQEAGAKLSLAKILHFRGVDGDVAAAHESAHLLEELQAQRSEDPLVLAYLGSSRLVAARLAWAPWRKIALVREGLDLMDRSVKLAPNDPEVLFLRGASTRPLPRPFGRAEQSTKDLTEAAARAKQASESGALDKQLAAAIFYLYGFTLLDHNDRPGTETAWRTAYDLAPSSKAGRKAAGRLGLP